ncbi:hypothetical protein [Arthrobacter sp. AD-310]
MGILELFAVMAALFAAAVFMAVYKDRDRAMAALVGASAALVSVQVLRVHVFTLLVVVWWLVPPFRGNRGSGKRITIMGACSSLLAATALYGDLVVSPTLALQLLAFTASASLIVAKSSIRDRQDMLYGALAVITASSFLGILQVAKVAPIEIWHAHVSSVGRPIGIYPEPDYLGLFSGLGLLASWRLPMRPLVRSLFIAVNGASLVFAFARAAWIAVGVSVVLVILFSLLTERTKDARPKGRGKWPALALLAAAGATYLSLNGSFAQDLIRRLQGTFKVSETDISGQARVRQIDGLLEMAQTAPWYGHGLSSNGRVGIWGGVNMGDVGDSANAVSSNWLLMFWVDGRLLAVPLIAFLIILAGVTCRTLPGQLLVVILLNSMFSNATFQPITWLVVGLALSTTWDRTITTSAPPSGIAAEASATRLRIPAGQQRH